MTNKEAVNWIINLSADIGKSEHSELWHYEQALYEIREMLESARQWIPVGEGLPKENGKYLVSVEKSEWDGTTRRSVRTMTYNKREVAPFQWGHYEIYSGKVTAWMDLPEPYKGGDVE